MSEQSNKPTEPIDNEERLEYRILCNSEHFLVLHPRPKHKKKREGEKEPRKKGRLLVKK